MARFRITNGLQQGRVLRLKPGMNRLGRSAQNHLQISDPSISGIHCEVIVSEAAVLVRDLDSTNGTCVDGQPVRESTIRPQQVLQLGNVEMQLEEAQWSSESSGIDVPEISVGQAIPSPNLPDGSRACANHSEIAASHRCIHCGETLCAACVRTIRRVAGDELIFCSLCSGPCESIMPAPALPAEPARRRKKGLFVRLGKTLKLGFRR